MKISLMDTNEGFLVPDLVPDSSLWEGYQACLQMRKALDNGELVRTSKSVEEWRAQSENHDTIYTRMISFLRGEKLEAAEAVLERVYRNQVSDKWASLALVLAADEVLAPSPLDAISRNIALEHVYPFGASPTALS